MDSYHAHIVSTDCMVEFKIARVLIPTIGLQPNNYFNLKQGDAICDEIFH